MNIGFTLLMEAYLLTLAKVLPVTEVSKQSKVSQDRIWHLIDPQRQQVRHRFFRDQRAGNSTWQRRIKGRTLTFFFTPGKDKATFAEFCAELKNRGIEQSQIEEVAMDMFSI